MKRKAAVAAFTTGILLLVGVMFMASYADTAFNRSMEGMEQVSRSLDEGETLHDLTIGDLTFQTVFEEAGAVYFRRADEPSGYVWSPHRPPSDTLPIRGPWYTFHDLDH
ncbi:hypothetical protein [Nonomuraea longicatena]|uniref:Uncharacterized protein n=1 Tax=Nonomuraea longicatena TaxID=83682 RepID=A0ABP3ZSA8_9ACTN